MKYDIKQTFCQESNNLYKKVFTFTMITPKSYDMYIQVVHYDHKLWMASSQEDLLMHFVLLT